MRFGELDIEPARCPAVLDTGTWDRKAAAEQALGLAGSWSAAPAGGGHARADLHSLVPAPGFLADLPDGQAVFLVLGSPRGGELPAEPLLRLELTGKQPLLVYPTDAEVTSRLCRLLRPRNAPRALGRMPRLGCGARMSTRVWPGVFAAMDRRGFAANSIQNSVRELRLLEDLRAGREAERNYASGFGMIESGYTGSTFQGLWIAGVLAALRHRSPLDYGADADHIQIKRTDHDLERATRVIEAARYYTFYTLDPADILSYASLERKGEGEGLLAQRVPDQRKRRDLLSYHTNPVVTAGRTWKMDRDTVGRCVGKYWDALEATTTLVARIADHRGGEPFDLEFAFDEHPPEVPGPACISGEEEVLFLVREIRRRGLPVSHIAPNIGVEKGYDYRLPDGAAGLRGRVEVLHRIAEEAAFMLDIHSADDLSARTRRILGEATGGRLHFKISPVLQLLFAEVLHEQFPGDFLRWWEDALGYATVEAEGGSPVAAESLRAYRSCDDPSPSPKHEIFRQFFFAFTGRRDATGRFVNRERLYELPEGFSEAYRDRVATGLCEISDDLSMGKEGQTCSSF